MKYYVIRFTKRDGRITRLMYAHDRYEADKREYRDEYGTEILELVRVHIAPRDRADITYVGVVEIDGPDECLEDVWESQ